MKLNPDPFLTPTREHAEAAASMIESAGPKAPGAKGKLPRSFSLRSKTLEPSGRFHYVPSTSNTELVETRGIEAVDEVSNVFGVRIYKCSVGETSGFILKYSSDYRRYVLLELTPQQ
jgi:hypothetical protein